MKKILLAAAISFALFASIQAFAVRYPPGCYNFAGTIQCLGYGF